MSQARASAGRPALATWYGIIRKRRSGAIGMLDGADGAAQFGKATQPADRGIAGIGPRGFLEIVEHAVAVIGAGWGPIPHAQSGHGCAGALRFRGLRGISAAR